ncbi:NAD(P)-binding domain-containing protein [Exiguobacterium aurantiacum]|uniref:NAD(P)-binding domain-containing protein n=1 Tax=Exiguobacterium aurantiacum TaxID=33987 RepID=A0ABY5FKK4_9BACL|nr:NAD(P)-binding domain-containing protein [Exiguobacterium aurantiacum]UTT42016.1 NAD(P)-binding domain-containing protein [Exiguobacterium aurantiacum]
MVSLHTRILIIGGGVHGMTLAVSYLEQGGSLDDLMILDANDSPLANWKTQTARISMSHLRSTRVHHLSSNPHALKQFAACYDYGSHHFKDTFGRPSLALFNDHCDQTIDDWQLSSRFIGNEPVARVTREKNMYVIETNQRRITADVVIVATGQSSAVHLPDWAGLPSCRHIFSTEEVHEQDHVTVVGGGITALHYVLARYQKGHHVTLVTKRPLEVSQFDADRSFMGPKGLRAFHQLEDDWIEKRSFVKAERRPGTSPNDLVLKVKRLIRQGVINHVIGEAVRCDEQLYVDGQALPSTEIVCCTGIRPLDVTQSFLRPLLEQLDLPLTPCGTPVLDETLAWTDDFYMTGAYADLIVGPFARAIYGGQEAARRIVPRLFSTQKYA